jgi:hypothetical protein
VHLAQGGRETDAMNVAPPPDRSESTARGQAGAWRQRYISHPTALMFIATGLTLVAFSTVMLGAGSAALADCPSCVNGYCTGQSSLCYPEAFVVFLLMIGVGGALTGIGVGQAMLRWRVRLAAETDSRKIGPGDVLYRSLAYATASIGIFLAVAGLLIPATTVYRCGGGPLQPCIAPQYALTYVPLTLVEVGALLAVSGAVVGVVRTRLPVLARRWT